MDEPDNGEDTTFDERIIEAVQSKVERDTSKALARLDSAMEKINNTLAYRRIHHPKSEGNIWKQKMEMMGKALDLLKRVRELAGKTVELVEKASEVMASRNGGIIPHDSQDFYAAMGTLEEYISEGVEQFIIPANRLAIASEVKEPGGLQGRAPEGMVESCYNLVRCVCRLENDVVTRKTWNAQGKEKFPDPGGMIGYTYWLLKACEESTAEKFKKEFQPRAKELSSKAKKLWKDAAYLEIGEKPPDTGVDKEPPVNTPDTAIKYLNGALKLLKQDERDSSEENAINLVEDAIKFLNCHFKSKD